MPLGAEVGLVPGHIVLNVDPEYPKEAQPSHNFRPTCCGHTTGWIKMPLGTKVDLGPGHIVLDGHPAPRKRAQAPIFGPCLLWPNGCMD